MPFVTKEHRDNPDRNFPGDRCYIEYKKIVDKWLSEPRWTTVDKILEELDPFGFNQIKRAQFLAFLVFFNLHVMPYEEQKRVENGDIPEVVTKKCDCYECLGPCEFEPSAWSD